MDKILQNWSQLIPCGWFKILSGRIVHLILLQFAVMLLILAPKIPNLKRPGAEFDFVL